MYLFYGKSWLGFLRAKSCKSLLYFFSNSLSRKNNGKIFWLKKSFRKPVVNNNTDEDLKLWPRKKANVTFANELFIDDIHDLNEDSSNSKQSNFISDFNDMYKFTLISPRRNRRSKSWKNDKINQFYELMKKNYTHAYCISIF